MLDATCRDVLNHVPAIDGGRWLVLLGPPARCLQLDIGSEVLFGRGAVDERGVIEVVDVLAAVAPDPTLSRRHARLAVDEGGAYVVDLGSTNGTWLNEQRLAAHVPTRLTHGDTLRVGASCFAWLDDAPPTSGRHGSSTGVLEREAFEQACLTALLRAQRYERPLALLVASDDAAGSAATAAPPWSLCLRPDDVLGRLAPGEWAVLLPETNLHDARALTDALQAVARRAGGGELRPGITALAHDAWLGGRVGQPNDEADLALDLDTVRLFIAAAREDRDTQEPRLEEQTCSN